MSLKKLRNALDGKRLGSTELCRYYLDRIKEKDRLLNSFITVDEDEVIRQAEMAQKLIDSGRGGFLGGIPISVKDNICTEGIKTTCASKMLENFVPPYNAEAVKRLREQGAVILGKTNMDEFAMGSTGDTSYFGGIKNPHNLSVTAGGSSGGAAAGVAAGLCPGALGTDTGGSVRQPASFCGVTGLAPTYGRVSRFGLIAFASSLDRVGIITPSAEDCGYILNCIAGEDNKDSTASKSRVTDFTSKAGEKVTGLKIGLPKEFFSAYPDGEICKSVLAAADFYKRAGCELVEMSVPSLEYAVAAYYLLSSAEAASNLSRFDGIKFGHRSAVDTDYEELIKNSRSEGFGTEVKRRIMLGNYALSGGYYEEYYKNALRIRRKIIDEYNEIFRTCDVILTPTVLRTAYKPGEYENNPEKIYADDVCTVPASIAGLPAISTVCGYDKGGLPIGMSLTGRAFDEETIIGMADIFEREFPKKAVEL